MNLDDIKLEASSGGPDRKISNHTKQRIIKIAGLIRNGYTRTRVIEELMENDGVKEVQAKRLYKAAIEYITPNEEERGQLRDEIIATTRNMIEKCIADGDKTNALRAMEQLNRLTGNYTEKSDINIGGSLNFGFSFDTGLVDSEEDGEENN